MRTTINIDDGTLERLKRESRRTRSSLTETVNRVLRVGLERSGAATARPSYRCPVFDLGTPHVELDKALEIAARLEDEEIARKLQMQK